MHERVFERLPNRQQEAEGATQARVGRAFPYGWGSGGGGVNHPFLIRKPPAASARRVSVAPAAPTVRTAV